MSSKYLKAKNFLDIIKHIIIALEEIGFRAISLIVGNNVTNKLATSFFCHLAKLSTIYPHQVMESTLFLLCDSVNIFNWLGQEDARKCRMFTRSCHNEKHELVFKVPYFVPYRNLML